MICRNIFFLVGAGILFSSCDSAKYFEEYQKLPNHNWKSRQKLIFDVETKDPTQLYNLFVGVRNTESFKYSNLYLFMDVKSPSGKLVRDTIECILADKEGRWYGSHSGDIVDNKIWFKSDYRFEEAGNYQFGFEQAMRDEVLQEITDFGLRIEIK